MFFLATVCKYKRTQLMRLSFQSHKIHIYLYSPLDSDFHVTQRWVTKRQTGFEVMASSLWTGGSLLQRRTNSGSKTLHSVMLRYFPLPAFLELFSKGDFTSGKTHKLSQIKTVLSVTLTVSDLSLSWPMSVFFTSFPHLSTPHPFGEGSECPGEYLAADHCQLTTSASQWQ